MRTRSQNSSFENSKILFRGPLLRAKAQTNEAPCPGSRARGYATFRTPACAHAPDVLSLLSAHHTVGSSAGSTAAAPARRRGRVSSPALVAATHQAGGAPSTHQQPARLPFCLPCSRQPCSLTATNLGACHPQSRDRGALFGKAKEHLRCSHPLFTVPVRWLAGPLGGGAFACRGRCTA